MFFLFSALAGASSKLDPAFQVFSSQALSLSSSKSISSSSSLILAFIRSSDPERLSQWVEENRGEVRFIAGNILSVRLPASLLSQLQERDEVEYVEAAKPMMMKNDLALSDINAELVHEGVEIPQSYTGAGTIIGIVDTGLDLSHPDFHDAQGKSRVIATWDQKEEGTPPEELIASYGHECTPTMLSEGSCSFHDPVGHGTHIAGTATARHGTYGGVAPDANLIVVRYRSEIEVANGYATALFSTTICEAVYYIFKKAEKLGMPAVVNLSLGTHIGAHDGTSLFEQCLDSLVAARPGRALVASAGNETIQDEAFSGLHASTEVQGLKAFHFSTREDFSGNLIYLDTWASSGSELQISLALHKGNPSTSSLITQSRKVKLGEMTSGDFLDGNISYQINATEKENPLNKKAHIGISIFLSSSFSEHEDFSFDLILEGKGHVDAWLYPDRPARAVNFTTLEGEQGQAWTYIPGDRQMTIAIPATAKEVIAVGAYATRTSWKKDEQCCEVEFALGKLLDFSSVGPSADPGRVGVKPELVAPGGMIASTLSHESHPDAHMMMPDGDHVLDAGTSMAAPFVSGAAALIFSVNPAFTASDVKHILIASAAKDETVGEVPNDAWGYGKLDVYKAIEIALQTIPSSGLLAPSTQALNGKKNSSGGCSMQASASPDFFSVFFILVNLCGWRVIRFRFSRKQKLKYHNIN
ncbi:MAG: hypothetical protein A3I05_00820 [Deltaproteobacteria bacterium RIFCSPLOWO2_02_FULL_44_10]|nr:MAG: hypothetical protein A3C46_03285 [Deltaproteobacteria bacterium RIFCSPHIGHO2_02_FULL_44_16]OGQ45055.1 MAG: hypothetical protein A3I05_00820 [Deltaproteobacteria bacterium RIFCSPLOWO2_02_FULL_44_10]